MKPYAFLPMFCLLFLVGACSTTPPPLSATTREETREELEDFQQSLQDDAKQAHEYLRATQNGTNLSEFTLGWFVYDVLTELSSQDEGLYKYFNKNNGDLQSYLKIEFRDRPIPEIAGLEALAKQGHPTLRLGARFALETLRHIPNPGESPEIQDRDRRELAGALATLQDLLEKSAREVPPP